ncbi:MAG: hypothetical protein LC667_20615, partial [Thioalkalivibrio sp.]|nr:hypothetical protein [Thioalkalivibrio sp.]
ATRRYIAISSGSGAPPPRRQVGFVVDQDGDARELPGPPLRALAAHEEHADVPRELQVLRVRARGSRAEDRLESRSVPPLSLIT